MPYSCIVRAYVDTKHMFFQPGNRKRLKFNTMHALSNPLFYCISWPLQLTIEFGLLSEQYFCNLGSIGFLLIPYSCIVRACVDTKHKFFQPANRKRLKFNIMHAVLNPLFYCILWPLQLTIEFVLVSEQYFCNLGSIGFLLMPYSCIVRAYVDTKNKFFQPANRKRLKFNIMYAVSNPLFYCISWPLQLTIEFYAAEALKFNRTQGAKPHNINFHVFFDYAPGITCFVYLHGLSFDTRVSHWQKVYGPKITKIQVSDRDKFQLLLQRP